MFRSLRISHLEFRFPGSEKLGPSRNGRMERNFPVITIFRNFRPTSRGTPKISEWNSGKCLFHSLPNLEFPEFLVEWKAPVDTEPNLWKPFKLCTRLQYIKRLVNWCLLKSDSRLSKHGKFHPQSAFYPRSAVCGLQSAVCSLQMSYTANFAALLATWQYFSFRHIRFSKLLSYQKLSQIILSYF